MQVKVAARHGHLTPDLQADIRARAEKLLHFFDRIAAIEVTVDLRGDAKQAEVLVNAEHKHDFVARDEHPDPAAAVALAVERVRQQIQHYKDRIQDHRRDPSHGGEGR